MLQRSNKSSQQPVHQSLRSDGTSQYRLSSSLSLMNVSRSPARVSGVCARVNSHQGAQGPKEEAHVPPSLPAADALHVSDSVNRIKRAD